jgi:hypothetical protein
MRRRPFERPVQPLLTHERPTTTKTVTAKALRHGTEVAPAPNIWNFRKADRGRLTVNAEGLAFESWSIPRRAVIDAQWFAVGDMPIQIAAILRVRTRDGVFEFAVEPWRLSEAELPFAVDRAEFSILSRRAKLLMAGGLAVAIVGLAVAG